METSEKKSRFVRLRAKGWSYGKIAERLKVAKGTCSAWETELNEEISRCKREELEALYEEFGMAKTARIRRFGGLLARIEATLAEVDFAEIPPEKLLDLHLRFAGELQKEHVLTTPLPPVGWGAKKALDVLDGLLRRLRDGEISESQAKLECAVVSSIVKTIDSTELHQRLKMLEGILKERE